MYTINPCKEIARQARHAQANKVKKSIIYLIQECEKKLNIKNDRINLALLTLPKIKNFSPEAHYFHHILQASMRSQDSIAVKLYLFKLIDAICHTSIANSIENWPVVTTVSNSEWETFIISETLKLTKKDCGQSAEIEPIDILELSMAKDIICAALCNIARFDPSMFDEIQEQVCFIKIFDGKKTMGLTDVRILGAMFIRIPRLNVNPMLYFIEHIVHEASHIHLNCLMAIDPLILNSPHEKFTSPLRLDPRPMIGVFHATYVSVRIARVFLNLYKATNKKELLHPLAENLDEAIRGINEIEKHARLTSNGRQLIMSIKKFIESTKVLSEWKQYDFTYLRTHRFGAGLTKVAALQRVLT